MTRTPQVFQCSLLRAQTGASHPAFYHYARQHHRLPLGCVYPDVLSRTSRQ
ncbi:hypothetical protein AAVH_18243 [Aphelenchoides avenae]|nr:hypothetical protein AAVH_18243 [Aphelenchus avenae]